MAGYANTGGKTRGAMKSGTKGGGKYKATSDKPRPKGSGKRLGDYGNADGYHCPADYGKGRSR